MGLLSVEDFLTLSSLAMTFRVVTSWGAELGAGGWTVKGSNEGGAERSRGTVAGLSGAELMGWGTMAG